MAIDQLRNTAKALRECINFQKQIIKAIKIEQETLERAFKETERLEKKDSDIIDRIQNVKRKITAKGGKTFSE